MISADVRKRGQDLNEIEENNKYLDRTWFRGLVNQSLKMVTVSRDWPLRQWAPSAQKCGHL